MTRESDAIDERDLWHPTMGVDFPVSREGGGLAQTLLTGWSQWHSRK